MVVQKATVKGVEELERNLRAKLEKYGRKGQRSMQISVGYSAPYAIFVHENKNPVNLGRYVPRRNGNGFYWGPPQYGPKFLENTIREGKSSGEFQDFFIAAMKRNEGDIETSLYELGARILEISNTRIPVDNGELIDSGYVKII